MKKSSLFFPKLAAKTGPFFWSFPLVSKFCDCIKGSVTTYVCPGAYCCSVALTTNQDMQRCCERLRKVYQNIWSIEGLFIVAKTCQTAQLQLRKRLKSLRRNSLCWVRFWRLPYFLQKIPWPECILYHRLHWCIFHVSEGITCSKSWSKQLYVIHYFIS